MGLQINFYCDENYKDRIPEPISSSKCFPKWFSQLPIPEKKYAIEGDDIYSLKINKDSSNIKKCFGITEFLKTGYIIPAWADFVFREQENGDLYINWVENYYDKTEYLPHFEDQYFTMQNKPIYGHFGKIFTPWMIKTDPGVSCLFTHPVWHDNKSFTSSTAIIHTDKTPLRVPWFFEWNYKIKSKMNVDDIDLKNQVVSKGEPIVLIIPFYRKNFSSKINYVSEKIFENMNNSMAHMTHDTVNSKCPYINFRRTLGNLFK